MNGQLPELNQESVELWIEALVADELSANARRSLIDFLESCPRFWRTCAVRFLDEQYLRATITHSMREHSPVISRPTVDVETAPQIPDQAPLRKPTGPRFSLAAACLLSLGLGMLSQWFWQHSRTAELQQTLIDQSRRSEVVFAMLASEIEHTRNLASAFPDRAGFDRN